MKNNRKILRNALCLLVLLCLTAATLTGCFAIRSEAHEGRADLFAHPSADSSVGSDASVQTPAEDSPEESAGWNDERKALIRSLVMEMVRGEGDADDFTIYGEVGAYTLCRILHGEDAAIVEDVFAGYRIRSTSIGYPSATHLYLVGDDAVYTLRAAYARGLIDDMGALYALLPKEMQAGCEPDAEDSFSFREPDWFGFEDGVYCAKPEKTGCGWSETREALVNSLTNMAESWFHGDGEVCVDPQAHASYCVYGEVGAYTLCSIYLPTADCGVPATETYSGYSIFSWVEGCPSVTQLYLVSDAKIYTLNAAYLRGMIRDMGALYALLPAEMQAGYDPDAEDAYRTFIAEDREEPFGFMDGVYRAK